MAERVQTPLLLLHGLFGHPVNWRPCIEKFSQGRRVLAPDLPILRAGRDSGVLALVRHVRDLLSREGIERAVVVGNSLGGHLALHLALQSPDLVQALVLSGSSGLFERGFERNVPRRPGRDWVRGKIRDIFYDEARVTEELVDEVLETIADPQRARQIVRIAKSAKRDNLSQKLHCIACPVLLLWGSQDRITPPVVAHEFLERLPRAALELIPRCGHAPMIERPDEYNRHLERFLLQVARAGQEPTRS